MYIAIDMGTSNTRAALYEGGELLGFLKGDFGAGSGKSQGREYLLSRTRELLLKLLSEAEASESDVEYVIVSGMGGSEMGLYEVKRIALPAGLSQLAEAAVKTNIPEVLGAPFVFVPGLMKAEDGRIGDVIRGEETEAMGILSLAGIKGEAVLVLPGTHNKVMVINENGEISDFRTTMSGELLNLMINHSILAGQVSHGFEISEEHVFKGAEYAEREGLVAALFHVRVMGINGDSTDELSSFLYGAVIGEEIKSVLRMAGDRPVYVGGRESLKKIYGMLIGEKAIPLSTDVADGAVRHGLYTLLSFLVQRK